jgi:hypothetical protein
MDGIHDGERQTPAEARGAIGRGTPKNRTHQKKHQGESGVDRFGRRAYNPAPMKNLSFSPRRAILVVALSAATMLAPNVVQAQASAADDHIRIGVTLGGISTFGLVVEFFDGNQSLDLTVGTFSFHDLSISAVAKRYVGSHAGKLFVGGGLWIVLAKPPGERLGVAAVVRAPIGVDVTLRTDHHLGAAVNLNRALFARRTDPLDDLPLNKGLIPLPGFYYKLEVR